MIYHLCEITLADSNHPLNGLSQSVRRAARLTLAGMGGVALGLSGLYGYNVAAHDEVGITAEASGPLPRAVAAQEGNIVHILGAIPTSEKQLPDGQDVFPTYRYDQLSGISLGDGYFLSAGHGVIERGKPLPTGALACSRVTIDGYYNSIPSLGNYAQNNSESTDVAVYKVAAGEEYRATGKANVHLPANLEISTEPLHMHEVVYFENYEPTASGQERGPNAPVGLNTPAVFPGVVIATGPIPEIVVDIRVSEKVCPIESVVQV